MGKGMGGHQSASAVKYEWLTPPALIQSLGEFDLDPCAPINRPWPTAKHHYTIEDDGLFKEWFGRVWLNPPYGKYLNDWMQKMAMHGQGTALIFARTDTATFHEFVFPKADSILFIRRRIIFYNVDGSPGKFDGGAPSVLIAYGEQDSDALASSNLKGHHLLLNRATMLIVSVDRTWRMVVESALVNLNREADLGSIYKTVEQIAPEKVEGNRHYQEKIRQILQLHFTKIKKGVYGTKITDTVD